MKYFKIKLTRCEQKTKFILPTIFTNRKRAETEAKTWDAFFGIKVDPTKIRIWEASLVEFAKKPQGVMERAPKKPKLVKDKVKEYLQNQKKKK